METGVIHVGDCLDILSTWPDAYIDCCVTSPPYYGLRDYGTGTWEGGDPACDHITGRAARTFTDASSKQLTNNGAQCTEARDTCPKCGAVRIDQQLGLEPTMQEYIDKLVAVFREVRRVLKPEGTLFLNLGDSYYGSGKGLYGDGTSHGTEGAKQRTNAGSVGVRNAGACGTSDKAPVDCQAHGCLCENLCDVCRVAYRSRKFHNDAPLVPMLIASLSAPTREHMGFEFDHLATLDSSHPVVRNLDAILGFARISTHEYGRVRASLASTIGESYLPLLDECWRRGDSSACLLCGRSLNDDAQGYAHMGGCSCGTSATDNPLACRNSDISSSDSAHPYYTTPPLKPKDLCMIPARVALALQADGWYLRSDIIWAKNNPMPESVTDRPTSAYEHVYLLSKQARYWYDADAIAEPSITDDIRRPYGSDGAWAMDGRDKWQSGAGQARGKGGINSFRGQGSNRDTPNGPANRDGRDMRDVGAGNTRNARNVWTIATKPYSQAHFATFPPELPRRCILAGCPPGGIVCDPFMGSGTVGMVAEQLGRQWVGIELNPEYAEMARKRTQQMGLFSVRTSS